MQANTLLVRYLEKHQGSSKYLVATISAGSAESLILATGKPVMDLGGFMGGDRILTARQLAQRVRAGQVRFFLVNGGGFDGFRGGFRGGPGGAGGNDDLSTWITTNCAAVPSSAYSTHTSSSPAFGLSDQASGTLYDCASK
jgi:hypothetical protein